MKYYLATTGISKIWDWDSKLLLLGPWCVADQKNKDLVREKDYILVPSPWKTVFKIKEAADYCHKIYEELLPQLSENLNFIHQIEYPIRYWRTLLGYWLLHFIGIFYERYKRIENVCENFSDFYTHVLPERECNYAAFDTYDLFSNCRDDDYYNLKLFSVICNELCPQNITEEETQLESRMSIHNYSMKRKLFYYFLHLSDLFLKNPIVLSEMHHLTPLDMFMLKVKSGFKTISFIDFDPTPKKNLNYNYLADVREKLTLKGANDRFQKLLYKSIPKAIPKCYLENFSVYRNSISKVTPACIIGSAIGWYFINERFKFYVAESVASSSKTIEFLHGGNYGYSFSIFQEPISLEKDIFYCWGWGSTSNTKIKNLPSAHLSKIKDAYSYSVNKILFIGQAAPKYMFRFHTILCSDDITKYFDDKKKFFSNLSTQTISKILYRPYILSYNWDEIEVMKKLVPNIKFLLGTHLIKWMKKVKLVVIDHPHTSFLEALAINVPCIFYWDHDVYLMKDEAEEYFELLRKAGILYKDPVSAAEKVNKIFKDPLAWWLNDNIQKARTKFCEHYAYAEKDWLKIWAQELKQLYLAYNN